MAGSSIFEYVHQEDHAMLGEEMGMKQPSSMNLCLLGSIMSDYRPY